MTEVITENIGNAMSEKCNNVHIINELNIPVVALGLKNVVISASSEGILVSDKEQSPYLKTIVDRINQPIMFAEKSWGIYQVMNIEDESLTIKITLNPGCSMHYHSHKNRDEIWVVIAGEGKVILDGRERKVNIGDIIEMKAGIAHMIFAFSTLKLIGSSRFSVGLRFE